eukprot:6092831-Pleurochrysis_carterae.AAC.4
MPRYPNAAQIFGRETLVSKAMRWRSGEDIQFIKRTLQFRARPVAGEQCIFLWPGLKNES